MDTFSHVIFLPVVEAGFATVDADSPEEIWNQVWRLRGPKNRKYVGRRAGQSSTIYLHRAVMGEIPAGMEVDHRNDNTFDNVRRNLRVCSKAGNAHNQRKQRRNTLSKYKGVSKSKGQWRSSIRFLSKQHHIGTYSSEVLAAQAYDREARRLFGEFACVNFPVAGEQSAIGRVGR